tara:strand:+ start:293 stop:445 length:153 start_codon:yes stop_codon:yes gene_type:complete
MQRERIKDVPLSYHDHAIYWYHEEIDRCIGADEVPADLQFVQVLAPYAIG